jgi:hypothetical protein
VLETDEEHAAEEEAGLLDADVEAEVEAELEQEAVVSETEGEEE